jgi:hypothetical protein
VEIFAQGLVARRDGGWRITEAGRSALDVMERGARGSRAVAAQVVEPEPSPPCRSASLVDRRRIGDSEPSLVPAAFGTEPPLLAAHFPAEHCNLASLCHRVPMRWCRSKKPAKLLRPCSPLRPAATQHELSTRGARVGFNARSESSLRKRRLSSFVARRLLRRMLWRTPKRLEHSFARSVLEEPINFRRRIQCRNS